MHSCAVRIVCIAIGAFQSAASASIDVRAVLWSIFSIASIARMEAWLQLPSRAARAALDVLQPPFPFSIPTQQAWLQASSPFGRPSKYDPLAALLTSSAPTGRPAMDPFYGLLALATAAVNQSSKLPSRPLRCESPSDPVHVCGCLNQPLKR